MLIVTHVQDQEYIQKQYTMKMINNNKTIVGKRANPAMQDTWRHLNHAAC